MLARLPRLLWICFCVVLVTPSAHAEDVVRTDLGAAIDRQVSCLAAFGISGALFVEMDGVVLVEKGYGVADHETGARVSAKSAFLIGSLSKQFTAAAVLALEADGRLSVADSIGRFYPDAPPATRALTLHQILSHTSGLPYLTERPFFESRPRDSVMSEMLALPLQFPPGAKYSYSNCGYALLAGVIERASGRRFEDYLHTRLFERAGLTRTLCLEPSLRDTAALLAVHSYSGSHDEGTMLQFREMSKSVGVGSVVSTAADLGLWAEALATDRVLPTQERDLLFASHATVNATTSYGYGWNVVKTSRGTTMFTHAGDLGGWNSEMRIDRDAKLVLVFLSNQRIDGRGSRSAVLTPVTLIATGGSVAALPALRTSGAEERKALVGHYVYGDGGTLVAREQSSALEVSAEDAAGLARLAGGGTAPPDSLHLDQQALAIAEGLARHDFAAVRAVLHPSLPTAEAIAGLDTAMAVAERRLGPFLRAESVGSVNTGPGAALSFVRIQRQRGSALLRLGWVSGKVLAFDPAAPSVLPTMFLPAADGSWANVDPFSGQVIRLSVERDTRGRVVAVALGAGSGVARARRRG
jgi:CubicO group peptidase (beta-lactamase class C family)